MADGKITISFGGAKASTNGAAASSGMSNMERLLAQAKNKPTAAAPKANNKPVKPASALFADEDDDDGPSLPPPSLRAGPSQTRTAPKQVSSMSRAEKRAHEEALKLDASVFDYDSVYDGMKAAERKREDAKKAEDAEGKPKYIEAFLASAQTRRLDRLRAEEKMLQHEREKEGEEFADKDKFVTEAYKRQMEEVRKAEEEEKKREDALRKSKKGPGFTAFYQTMLNDDEERHAAAMAAANGQVDSGPSLAIRPPPKDDFEDEAEYDPMLARMEKSKPSESADAELKPSKSSTDPDVEINDDGEVVDKRTLLKAGLNIMKKPAAALPNSLLAGQRSGTTLEGPYKSRAVGTAAGYQERMERERKRLADQVKEEQERKRAALEAARKEEEEAARRRREGDNGEAQKKREEARLRALERKRAREEEKKGSNKKTKAEETL